jgi:Predicted xylanase/chitin deacetylase
MTLPAYYTTLAPFHRAFLEQVPVLMYHKLGPRPRRVRLKGLYVSADLFARQLQELRAAGFSSCQPDAALAQQARTFPRICLTFDDGYTNVHRYGLPALEQAGMAAIQFMVADRLGGLNDWDVAEGEAPERLMDAGQIREWLAAGHAIGSHGLSHARLTDLPLAQAREEIAASRKSLEDRFGVAVRHFCYPYGAFSPQLRDLVAEAGYASACTTMAGFNDGQTDPWSIRRWLVRYRSRSLKAWLAARRGG